VNATYPIPVGGSAVLAFDSLVGDNMLLFTVRADGTERRQLTSGPGSARNPVWSPDGTRIAYRASQDGTDSLAIIDTGGNPTLLTTGQQISDCAPGALAAWSPDGTTLIYTAGAGCDGPLDLFAVATDGSAPATQLLPPGLRGTAATWSPDGSRIAFVGQEENGETGLYLVDADAGDARRGGLQARRLTEAGTSLAWSTPRWSPDGTELVASAGTNDNCIEYASGTLDAVAVNVDGSGQRPLAAEAAKEYSPSWSPDGQQLAFQRLVDPAEWVLGRPCTAATWVADADGTNQRRLDGLGDVSGFAPFWSPDGTRLTGLAVEQAAGDPEQHFNGYVVTVDGSSPTVTINDVGIATWQPVAAPLSPAP
jgi:Tol biopolymer transport system component